ncbi:MAG TPA: magnesium transporter [Alphaproteobacteria bacterium]|nr:magnesium transporter [Alphaproteobacteria bacterium]HAJ46059.1 magnesium transporter [Alphaproteobacteria bacterium]
MNDTQALSSEADEALDAGGAMKPAFVRAVIDAVDRGDQDAVKHLLLPLHAADLADLLEMVGAVERRAIVAALGEDFDSEILSEIDEALRGELVAALGSKAVAEAVEELETADAAYVLEDLPEETQREVLDQISEADRADVVDALAYPDYSAGRLMHRDYVALPPDLTIGEAVKRVVDMDDAQCPDDFDVVFVIDAEERPLGVIPVSRLLRAPRNTHLLDAMDQDFEAVPATMDQKDFAYLFEHYHLTTAPVTDTQGRMIGVLGARSVVEVLQDEHQAQVLALGGVSDDEGLKLPVVRTTWLRFSWLFVNLMTAILASFVIGMFEASLEKIVALAILMPIVASMGGNAGTQTLTVAVRALATKDLNATNFFRIFGKELLVGWLNGLAFAAIIGLATAFWFRDGELGAVIAGAMVINLLAAAASGILVPYWMNRAGIDPAVSAAVFVTTVTDVVGFMAFLGLATIVLLR